MHPRGTLAYATNTLFVLLHRCRQAAGVVNYRYFGLRNGNQCWATNNFTVAVSGGIASTCTTACLGNSNQKCGGDGATSLYKVVDKPGKQVYSCLIWCASVSRILSSTCEGRFTTVATFTKTRCLESSVSFGLVQQWACTPNRSNQTFFVAPIAGGEACALSCDLFPGSAASPSGGTVQVLRQHRAE